MLSAEAKGWVLLKSAHGAERYFTVYLLTKANEFPLLKKQEYFHAKFSLMLETMFLVATIKALCHTTYTKPLPKPTEDRMLKHTEWLCLPVIKSPIYCSDLATVDQTHLQCCILL